MEAEPAAFEGMMPVWGIETGPFKVASAAPEGTLNVGIDAEPAEAELAPQR